MRGGSAPWIWKRGDTIEEEKGKGPSFLKTFRLSMVQENGIRRRITWPPEEKKNSNKLRKMRRKECKQALMIHAGLANLKGKGRKRKEKGRKKEGKGRKREEKEGRRGN